ncbi:sterol desaturase family protein [Candidatus Spongiihabitans sp.]|uniref:sterol desaturase family protein n=1 Tax=Candidatus Spongiihabitans sp. TaxID=3101308 RepID=UPI003C7B69C4
MNAIDAQFAAFADTFAVLELIGLIFLLAIVSETLWDILTGQRKKLGQTVANFAIALGNHFLERTLYGLVFIFGLFLAAPFAPFSIPITWWSWALALIAADLTYYWMHRWEHEIRILWAYHSVHHSSSEFNLTTGLRLAWVEGLIEWVFFVPMILIGFDVVQTIIALVIVVAYQTWIHTEKIGKLGWADRIFNTPSVHRVHHGSNRKYIDKNYGGILIVWDRLFGTYQAEEEKVIYGLTYLLGTSNPLTINVHEYWQIIKDARRSKNIHELFGYVFRPPGWKPNNRLQNE